MSLRGEAMIIVVKNVRSQQSAASPQPQYLNPARWVFAPCKLHSSAKTTQAACANKGLCQGCGSFPVKSPLCVLLMMTSFSLFGHKLLQHIQYRSRSKDVNQTSVIIVHTHRNCQWHCVKNKAKNIQKGHCVTLCETVSVRVGSRLKVMC